MFPKSPVKGTFSGDKVRPVLTFTLEIGRELLSKGRNKPTRIPNLNNTEGGGGGAFCIATSFVIQNVVIEIKKYLRG